MRGLKTREHEQKKRIVIFLVLLLLFGVLLNSVRKVYRKKEGAEGALARMNGEVEELKNRKVFLEESLKNLETEEGLKFEIRRKLNVAERGESVAIIVEEDSSKVNNESNESSWQKVKDFFSNIFN